MRNENFSEFIAISVSDSLFVYTESSLTPIISRLASNDVKMVSHTNCQVAQINLSI